MMAKIYQPSSHRHLVFSRSSSSFKKPASSALKINSYLKNFHYYEGRAKTVFLAGIFLFSYFLVWLILFGTNISLDYQIAILKQNIKKETDKINSLNEQLANHIDNNALLEWAQQNDFTELKSLSYLNLQAENLAQAPSHFNIK